MGPTIIARNYARTLFALGERHGGDETIDEFAVALEEVTKLIRENARIHDFLRTPRVDSETRKRVLRQALEGRVPELFMRFLLVVVDKRRQTLLPRIAEEYTNLVDAARGRVRAEIVIAREPSPELRDEIIASLEGRYGREVAANFRVDPAIIGGIVIRVGDQILDGSLRKRVSGLRRRLITTGLPRAAAI